MVIDRFIVLSNQGMTRTNPTEVYRRPEGIFCSEKVRSAFKGYEPKALPLKGSGMLQPLQPFYSERLQRELQLEALRPMGLPSPSDEAMPVRDAGLADGSSGKGRGGMAEGSVGRFATPNGQTMRPIGPRIGVQSQGVMPGETAEARQTMGPMHGHVKNVDVKNVEGEKMRKSATWANLQQCWWQNNHKIPSSTELLRRSRKRASCPCGARRNGVTLPKPFRPTSSTLTKDQCGTNVESPQLWQ